MKLSDYIAHFLFKQGVRHVFVVSGGAAIHMIDSVSKIKEMAYICAQHEQHAGAEADGYARIGKRLGAVIVTSGPGATNLTTSIANAYYDSIPILFLCGQVASFRIKKRPKLRQKGFQETDIVSIFRSITKYVARVTDPYDIRYHLEKAVFMAFEGRKGPVALDIPDDFSRSEIDEKKLKGFTPPKRKSYYPDIVMFKRLLSKAETPILILGAGVNLADAREEALRFIHKFALPTALTYGGVDVLPNDHPLNIGVVGVAGNKSTNVAIQKADLIIAIGTRLSPNVIGGVESKFAPYAKKIMVDIDKEELIKFDLDLSIHCDIPTFFNLC